MPTIFNPRVHRTAQGTPYLCQPGVALIAQPSVSHEALGGFLDGFGDQFDNYGYVSDPPPHGHGANLCKIAGQTCYLSFGKKRTKNADAKKYLDNILSSGHGSVLEHANYSFLLWGISRSLTHELVRHRVGTAFSQVSQRYVDGAVLRFVERPEWQEHPGLHVEFEERIDRAKKAYVELTDNLLSGACIPSFASGSPTDRRKAIQQASRSLLPNETEAPMFFSANVRALRHIIEMRGSRHAEPEIRALAFCILMIMQQVEPLLFSDYTTPNGEVITGWRKV